MKDAPHRPILTTKKVVVTSSSHSSSTSYRKHPRPASAQVQVVQCGRAFPISSASASSSGGVATSNTISSRNHQQPSHNKGGGATVVVSSTRRGASTGEGTKRPQQNNNNNNNNEADLLEFDDAVREVRTLAATAYLGQEKRHHDDEQYRILTGRDRARQYVPLPILRGIRNKAAQRQARQDQEARAAGIVQPTRSNNSSNKTTKHQKDVGKVTRQFGPAPSIGFTRKGVYRVQHQDARKKSTSKSPQSSSSSFGNRKNVGGRR